MPLQSLCNLCLISLLTYTVSNSASVPSEASAQCTQLETSRPNRTPSKARGVLLLQTKRPSHNLSRSVDTSDGSENPDREKSRGNQSVPCGSGKSVPMLVLNENATGLIADMQQVALANVTQDEELETSNEFRAFLPIELHLVGPTMQSLLRTYQPEDDALKLLQVASAPASSIASLLQSFQKELSAAAGMAPHRLTVTSILGKFMRYEDKPESNISVSSNEERPKSNSPATGIRLVDSEVPAQMRLGEEVVVRMVVHKKEDPGEPSEKVVFDSIAKALSNSSSDLRQGPLRLLLQNAYLTIGYQAYFDVAAVPAYVGWSSMFLPLAVSAAFTGILICLVFF